jgi:hypothetical protein
MIMTSDSSHKQGPKEGKDLWTLPKVVSLKVAHRQHRKPVLRFLQSKTLQVSEEVEFLVKTAGDFPIRALSPALYVGDVPITEMDRVKKNVYRFVAFGPSLGQLEAKAPISLGWAGVSRQIKTKYRFAIPKKRRN